MLVTELDTFVNKFQQLCYDGYNAHLDLDTHAGLVSLRVQLGQVPGPLNHQVPPPFKKNWRKRESPSRQRRRARRAAERQQQEVEKRAPGAETAKDISDKQPSENIDATNHTDDKEEMTKEELQDDNVKFNKFVDKETEQVEVRNTENVDNPIQVENESFFISYVQHEDALEKIEMLKDKFDDITDTTVEIHSFYTSTPKSELDRCEECNDKTECVDCFVKHMLGKHESLRKVLF